MKVYSGEGIGSMYYALIRDITEHGRKIVTRGQTCLELPEPVTLVYEKPGFTWMRIPSRKFNPFFALAEVMWILSGNGNVEWISYFNSHMRDCSDGKEDFHGAYGLRIRNWPVHQLHYVIIDQIEWVVRKLQRDPYSRQAVISLWDPSRDNITPSKDYPCNNVVYYALRDGLLDQTVVIRSNDIIWGTPYNAVQFTHLQALVAGMLGVKMGKLTYVIQNLHYYLDLYKPTLSNVIEQAYEKRIQAESIPSFDTIDEAGFEDSRVRVDAILKARDKGKIASITPEGLGYWGCIIPRMILLYTMLKETTEEYDVVQAANLIAGLGQPLTDLIIDFYRDSMKQSAQRLLELLQERMEA